MRLHSLEMTAFGPFAATQQVDLDSLAADGLFLLHGQTGAGKTTVLDAVAFALYGTVPGSRQDGRRLRSDHAAPGTPTEVTLEATIAGRRVRIRRSPEYMRPKKRGQGETKENARATLEWLDEGGENLSRIDEIARVVIRLLGMSAEQFFQVVLLPQGEFARFLAAETKARAALLERLFDTGRFGDVEQWFAQRRREGVAALEQGRQAVDVAVASLATAAGGLVGALQDEGSGADGSGGPGFGGGPAAGDAQGDGPAADSGGGAGAAGDGEGGDGAQAPPARDEDPAGWADVLVGRAQAEAESATTVMTERREESVQARRHADGTRDVARALRRRAAALEEVQRFDDAGEELERESAELNAARRAEQAGWAERARRDARKDHDAAAARVGAARRAFAELGPEAAAVLGEAEPADEPGGAPAVPDVAVLGRAGRRWDDELVRLEAALQDERALAELIAAEQSSAAAAAAARTSEDALAQEAKSLPERISAARTEAESAQQAVAALPALRTALDEARAVLDAAQAIPGAQKARDAASSAAEEGLTALNDARARALDLREQRLEGMAAELAGELRDGEPCAVCGASDHPRPAAAAAAVVTQDDEDSASARVSAAAERHETLRGALQEAETELALQRQRCGGATVDTARQRCGVAQERVRETTARAQRADEAAALLGELEERRRTLDDAVDEAARKRAGLDSETAALRGRIDDVRSRIAAVVGAGTDAHERSARLRTLRDGLDGVVDAATALRTAEAAAVKAHEAVTEAARAAGFDGAEQALAAVRPAARRTEIEAHLTRAHEAVAGARAVLEEPEVIAAAKAGEVDVDGAEACAAEAAQRLEEAVRWQQQASARATAVAAQAERVHAAAEALQPLHDEHAWLSSLTEVMLGDGENSRRMSLRSYVLAARLEEVAVVASQRLRVMSEGRYEFVHTEATVKRERRGGLGLDILDANTGTVRPTATLSGGETFMASLSLALGLADVVSEESGGIQLETLFIDEGFGTLDAETLDVVMGVLDELRAGGRAVGIVSHVAEMRHRIPCRLHVVKGEAGSRLEAVGAGPG